MTLLQKLACLGLLLGFIPTAVAHDFWLAPGQYYSDEPAAVSVQFKVGHEEDAANWNLSWDKIVALRTYSEGGIADMAASIIPRSEFMPGVAKTAKLKSGTHLIGFESYHSFSSLEAEKFNSYAEEEGLAEIIAYREKKGLTTTPGTELFSRKAKTMIQVGDALSDIATTPIGHTLEIVPLQHPAAIEPGDTLPVQVLFKGEPLANALIDATPLAGADHKEQALTTDNEGKATFRLTGKGPVKLNVIWGVALRNNQQADYESYFSSFTFTVR
ncbi:DUF4198 domain-containing protein [Alteromonas sp. ASW11-19]|uniref:DUF4198 domain-containing protein n=1 Tax=Alteromonas salexigens TaxID=2982530 RepID=A0ABT2VLP9_9ALTE|nr:DUF4198 domain-containing protein [Alteromonas salexigens]MCU7553196.1 DUF4198 domain-containing protein [Alteromonas salexigens]